MEVYFDDFKNYKLTEIPVKFGDRGGIIFSIDEKMKYKLAKKYAAAIKKIIEDKQDILEPARISLKKAFENYLKTRGGEYFIIDKVNNKESSKIIKEMEKSGLIRRIKIA